MQGYERATREQVQQLLDDTVAASSKSGKTKKKRTKRQIFASVFSTLVILALLGTLGSLVYTRVSGGYPQLFGYRIFQVETGSMIPTLPIGTFIVVRQPDKPDRLSIGDVITYKHESAVVTHRIINKTIERDTETDESYLAYVTKGDNPENSVDPWTVKPEDVLGVMVWHLSF